MLLYYEGVDITDDIGIVSCRHHDYSGGRCDCLELTLDDARMWMGWKPEKGDRIEAVLGSYTTGVLYLNTVIPEGKRYRIMATGLKPCRATAKWKSYHNMTLGEIMEQCAAEYGMEHTLYGMDAQTRYKYLLRRNESPAAFLNRLAGYEGAVLKSAFGRLTMIGVEKAQSIDASGSIEIDEMPESYRHEKRDGERYASLTILTPTVRGTANDTGCEDGYGMTRTDIPATDEATAARWSRGLLLTQNRSAEKLTMKSEFNVGFTAMGRVDIESATELSGEWICDEVTHDLINERSTATMLRCIDTIR